MTRVKGPDGLVTDVAASLARLVIGDGTRGFEYVDGGPAAKAPATPTEPKGNASRDEWAAWADHLGVEYDPEAKRTDIKAAVEAAAAERLHDDPDDDPEGDPEGDDDPDGEE